MLRAAESLISSHHLGLTLLAALLCVLGCVCTVLLMSGGPGVRRGSVHAALVGVCFASSAWATHFVAMLAWQPGLEPSWGVGGTAASYGIGIVGSACGFALASRGARGLLARALGGACTGGAVVALHWVGMAATRFGGTPTYAPSLVAASIASGVALGAIALALLLHPTRPGLRPVGGVVLALMVLSLHFAGMAAIDTTLCVPAAVPGAFGRTTLAGAAALAGFAVIAVGLAHVRGARGHAIETARSMERVRAFAEASFEGLVVHRDRTLVEANAEGRRLLGIAQVDVRGLSLPAWAVVNARELSPAEAGAGVRAQICERPAGDEPARELELRRRTLRLPTGEFAEIIGLRDLGERRVALERMRELATHDPVTGLANRPHFIDRAGLALASAREAGTGMGLVLVALEGIGAVNATRGLEAGDEFVVTAARRIANALGEGDVAGRISGAGFAVVLRHAEGPAAAARLRAAVALPVPVGGGRELAMRVSIGLASHPLDGRALETLWKKADAALHADRARADGAARDACGSAPASGAGDGAVRRVEAPDSRTVLEARLRTALDAAALSLAYQPVFDGATRRANGAEALLRWRDAELGSVSPADFVPVAEATGLIVPIGAWVLRRACADAASWPAPLRVAVNVSAVQFADAGFVDAVGAALATSGLDASRLELELDAAVRLADEPEGAHAWSAVRALGVRVSVSGDAAEAGPTPPVDRIKVTRERVSNVDRDVERQRAVSATLAAARAVSADVTAEGVESEAEAATLVSLGCDELQGYALAKPMSCADALERFEGERHGPARRAA